MSKNEAADQHSQAGLPRALQDHTGTHAQSVVAHAAFWVVYWSAATLVWVCAGWSLGLAPLPWAAAIGATVATVIMIVAMRRSRLPVTAVVRSLGLVLLVVAVSLALGGASHDFSADGQSYHMEAILAMMGGWNPIAETHYQGPFSIWLSHYAKGPWILSAALGKVFSVEYGKAISWLFAISAGSLSFFFLSHDLRLSRRAALVCAVLLACNPIVSSQVQTFYVDGVVASIILLTAISTYLLIVAQSWYLVGVVASCIIIAINLKFTSGPFVIVVIGGIWLWTLQAKRMNAAKALFVAGIAGLALGGVTGLNPYLTNVVDHQHPFYPLAGSGRVDILTDNAGQTFLAQNRFYKAALSLTSEGNNIRPPHAEITGAAVPKLPGVIKSGELKAFYAATDLRMGGFGPWASLALLVGIVYIILVVRRERFGMSSPVILPLIISAAMLASALIMPDFWWARYAPQLWTAMVFSVVVVFAFDRSRSGFSFGKLALVVIAANTTLMLVLSSGNRVVQELDFQAQVASLKKISSLAPLRIQNDLNLKSTRDRLAAHGIIFTESDISNCKNLDQLRGSDVVLCIPEASLGDYRRGSATIAKLLGRPSVVGDTGAQ